MRSAIMDLRSASHLRCFRNFAYVLESVCSVHTGSDMKTRAAFRLLCSLLASAAAASCGTSGTDPATEPAPGAPDAGLDDGGGAVHFGKEHVLTSLTIDPAPAAIEVTDSVIVPQPFHAVAHFDDQSSVALTSGVSWSSTSLAVGRIDAAGVYAPSGAQGGDVQVKAAYKGLVATAKLLVKLHLHDNPASVPAADQATLKGAKNPDATVVWAYPYDGTVFPRGLGAPPLMWNGGLAGDVVYVHLTSPTFELESFSLPKAPASFTLAPDTWQKFVDSTSGKAKLTVARLSAGAATVIADHAWTVAPASMKGTIYYWANNLGRVERIKPGATAPDDFSAGVLPGSVTSNGNTFTCTMTCHTVSADGSTLVSGGDVFAGTYDLRANAVKFDKGGTPGAPDKRAWAMPALSPNGKYLVENASNLPGPPGGSDGLFLTADGTRVPSSGLDGIRFGMPAFSPDGTRLAYVDASDALALLDFDLAAGRGQNARVLVQAGTAPDLAKIGFPSVSPDAASVVYHRGTGLDTRGTHADLYLASTATAGQEVRLANLDGDGYPFAAGARDASYNFEPTFAPVASGGYFWVVFTSRRTYGNALTGGPADVKQLWVAAIDQTPTPGKDPSHPAFRLPGQAIDSLNMRGFWALDPCKGDGSGCASGTECCGGYCDTTGDAGAPVCRSSVAACAQDGDHCATSSDCCDVATGTTCINHVCSVASPK